MSVARAGIIKENDVLVPFLEMKARAEKAERERDEAKSLAFNNFLLEESKPVLYRTMFESEQAARIEALADTRKAEAELVEARRELAEQTEALKKINRLAGAFVLNKDRPAVIESLLVDAIDISAAALATPAPAPQPSAPPIGETK
jgi:hypothetical protein